MLDEEGRKYVIGEGPRQTVAKEIVSGQLVAIHGDGD
jgi:hypothetical protein